MSGLPAAIRADIHQLTTHFPFGRAREIDVYGPGTEDAFLKATRTRVSTGLDEGPGRPPKDYYLVVLHGRFVCKACTGPAKQPVSVYFDILAAHGGETVGGLLRSLPAAVPKLHRLANIPVS